MSAKIVWDRVGISQPLQEEQDAPADHLVRATLLHMLRDSRSTQQLLAHCLAHLSAFQPCAPLGISVRL